MSAVIDYQRFYVQIGRLLEAPPDMSSYDALKAPAVLQWVGRAHALAGAIDPVIEAPAIRSAMDRFPSALWQSAVRELFASLYRLLARCELASPAAAAGSFLPVGNAFDAFAAISKILQEATTDVLLLDPYLDESALTEFGLAVPDGVSLRLLGDATAHKATLTPAASKWVQQYGQARPLQVRLASPKTLHDRAIFVDRGKAWTLTQSLKDFAKRSPAEIVRADDTAALKIAAYEAIWASATIVI